MRFPGQPPLQGHDAIKGFFHKQFSLLDSMTHTIGHVDVLPDRIYQEAKIEYVVKGDPVQFLVDELEKIRWAFSLSIWILARC